MENNKISIFNSEEKDNNEEIFISSSSKKFKSIKDKVAESKKYNTNLEKKFKEMEKKRIENSNFLDFISFPSTRDFKNHKSKDKLYSHFRDKFKKEIINNDNNTENYISKFLQSLFCVSDKSLSKNFMTVEFLNYDATLMLLYLRLLNSKRSEKMYLPEMQFRNIAIVLESFLDTIFQKYSHSKSFTLNNSKDTLFEILEMIIILGQTFYLQTNDSQKELISNRLQHSIWNIPQLWKELIEYHIKCEIKNQKSLGQKVDSNKKETIATATLLTYYFNFKNYSKDIKVKNAIYEKANQYNISTTIFETI